MDSKLKNGDHARDARGLSISLDADGLLIQNAMIRLMVKKGSFPLNRELGSLLWRLPRDTAGANALVSGYVQEALGPLRGVQVDGASCAYAGDRLTVHVSLTLRESKKTVELGVAL